MENLIYTQTFKSPWGSLLLGDFQGNLCLCDWSFRRMRISIDNRLQRYLKANYHQKDTELLQLSRQQLIEYQKGYRKVFDLPLLMIGSTFQKTVWEELLRIPYGKTDTYLSLSTRLGNPKAIRAVAAANGANAISIIVPCHRVIGMGGDLTGYAGGLTVKKRLLTLESSAIPTEQLRLF